MELADIKLIKTEDNFEPNLEVSLVVSLVPPRKGEAGTSFPEAGAPASQQGRSGSQWMVGHDALRERI